MRRVLLFLLFSLRLEYIEWFACAEAFPRTEAFRLERSATYVGSNAARRYLAVNIRIFLNYN
ncbi:hypothetical protein X777_16523 [Ooceraea biroi]|uniref:Uncharacterized protein n=1 Tax=Ooceraea biroi TaxID=2015173 RepID=A0A026VTZ3_OOCBI|nr:hypothetical protein X777_16523 [Ooceraea biroi]